MQATLYDSYSASQSYGAYVGGDRLHGAVLWHGGDRTLAAIQGTSMF